MRLLFVAHPDDELIWFRPEEYDEIHIFFGPNLKFDLERVNAIAAHPLKEKIVFYNLRETDTWKKKDLTSYYHKASKEIDVILTRINCTPTLVATHGPEGEYGHPEHQLIHEKVTGFFDPTIVKVPDINIPLRRELTNVERDIFKKYMENHCWTWKSEKSLGQVPALVDWRGRI